MDIDPELRPEVIADAWLPPFARDAFDVVIIDPPYHSINQQMKQKLLEAAAFVAKERVIWFHTIWIANGTGLRRRRAWLVRVGDSCNCRCIQEFVVVPGKKRPPTMRFSRGPAIKYNRWLTNQTRLPLEGSE